MVYLSYFSFPERECEYSYLMREQRTCFDSYYPFRVLSEKNLFNIEFESVTLLCGGNGCGKTTALNVIGEALKLKRDTLYNRSSFFEDYIDMCDYRLYSSLPNSSRVITSDDVFDYMLSLRTVNEGIDIRREELFEDYLDNKYADFHFKDLKDYDKLKKVNLARRTTKSKYIRESLMDNIRENSNGESAFRYFVEKIDLPGLYLLDEPENSLSPEKQIELKEYIENSVRLGCQFIIATHSPFIMSMKDTVIYDLSGESAEIKKWTEIENVKVYYNFFKKYDKEFKNE